MHEYAMHLLHRNTTSQLAQLYTDVHNSESIEKDYYMIYATLVLGCSVEQAAHAWKLYSNKPY